MTEDSKLYRTLGPIYISSIQPLLDNEDFYTKYKISTIISVTKSAIPLKYTEPPYKHLQIPIDDLASEIILPYIPDVNSLILKTVYQSMTKDFIKTSLINGDEPKPKLSGEGVLIHCQSGVSRSVAFLCAYLMHRHNLSLDHALHAIRRNNPTHTFQPNDGFMEQLEIYKDSNWCVDIQKLRRISPHYRAYRMEYLMTNILNNNNSDSNKTSDKFSDVEHSEGKDENWFGFKCAKCRALLASSEVYIPHSPPFDKNDKQMYFTKNAFRSKRVINRQIGSECSHIFTEPLKWMQDKLVNDDNIYQELEGRLDCYKCQSKIGGWNWKGDRCSCGKWMVPAIHLLKTKVVQIDRDNKLILLSDDRAI
jgi:dual specificity phosphatase 12